MAYEIEIKAHACRALKERIDAYVGAVGEQVVKSDTYYAFAHDEVPRFRLRLENGGILVSAKRNRRQDGLECNQELEFRHDDASDLEVMQQMAMLLGYEVFIHKHKQGWSWMKGRVHIELLDVLHLGWFLEMEIISNLDGFEANRPLYDELYGILHDLGLEDGDVERRSYQEMLRPFEPRS